MSEVLYFYYHSLSYKENQDLYQFLNIILCFKAQKMQEEVLLFPLPMWNSLLNVNSLRII